MNPKTEKAIARVMELNRMLSPYLRLERKQLKNGDERLTYYDDSQQPKLIATFKLSEIIRKRFAKRPRKK